MPRKPQRPFVPHHTPTTARPTVAAPEFRLYRPFLPGAERGMVEPVAFVDQSELNVSLRPIADFLDTSPTARDHPRNTAGDFYASEAEEEPDELPPVEHFLDPFEPGWGETDWQHYDWRGAAALGETSVDEATTAWADTDWDGTGHRAREPRESAAHAIATALDEIARRIREGDLSPSGPGPMTDPATIAATLAALLGVRR